MYHALYMYKYESVVVKCNISLLYQTTMFVWVSEYNIATDRLSHPRPKHTESLSQAKYDVYKFKCSNWQCAGC